MWIAGFAACGGEPKDEFDRSTFAGMNEDKIAYDCNQVGACNELRMTTSKGGYDECVSQNARTLNDDPSRQARFLTLYTRCQLHKSCDYTGCVMNPPVSSYGMMQIDKLNYLCNAKAQCGSEMGNPIDDPTTAVANCAGVWVGTLDNWSLDQRNQFEQTFAGCSTLASCQFLGCFPY